jgi:hypothetical protein
MKAPSRIFALLLLLIAGSALAQAPGPSSKPQPAPRPVRSQSQEILGLWNSIGNRLIAMADDWPEDKYSYKAQKDQRTFGENLLHVADEDYRMLNAIKGAPMGPGNGKDLDPANFKTKADIVKLIKQVVADGAALLQEQGEDGLAKEIKYPYGNMMVHSAFMWLDAIEHSGEHYGQLVVYYRLNNVVPPASRPRK